MTKAILFDVDGVLLDSFDANFEFYNRLFTKSGYTPPTKKQFSEKALFSKTMLDVICTVTQSTDEHEINRLMEIGKQRATIYPYDLIKTPKTLHTAITTLQKTYRLGLVTSRIKNGVFETPQLVSLIKYFGVIVCFEDTTKHKPDPEPLQYAMQQLHVSPKETIYIGDQQSDFLAARTAGTKIIMITKELFPDADVHITSFDDVPDAISKIA